MFSLRNFDMRSLLRVRIIRMLTARYCFVIYVRLYVCPSVRLSVSCCGTVSKRKHVVKFWTVWYGYHSRILGPSALHCVCVCVLTLVGRSVFDGLSLSPHCRGSQPCVSVLHFTVMLLTTKSLFPMVTPSAEALDTRMVAKIAIFDRNGRLSRKRYEIVVWLLMITNRKS